MFQIAYSIGDMRIELFTQRSILAVVLGLLCSRCCHIAGIGGWCDEIKNKT